MNIVVAEMPNWLLIRASTINWANSEKKYWASSCAIALSWVAVTSFQDVYYNVGRFLSAPSYFLYAQRKSKDFQLILKKQSTLYNS